MSIAICVLAKDEANSIVQILAQLADQSIVATGADKIQIHVVANGCRDETASVAAGCRPLFKGKGTRLHVHDLHPGGKSRAWNMAVHDLVDQHVEFFIFLDADIEFIDEHVLEQLLANLKGHPRASVCSGYPVKNISAKSRKSLLDSFSLAVSDRSQHRAALNGSLYVGRATALREVWLPNETPGEDGFLNAMVATHGFTMPPDSTTVIGADRPTHYYRAHGPFDFFLHERRMIVGTMVNIWIFELLWSLSLRSPAGPLIQGWNRDDPDWVERLIRQRGEKRVWLVRNNILFGRFVGKAGKRPWKRAAYLPIALMATILTLPPAIAANRRLKQFGAAQTW